VRDFVSIGTRGVDVRDTYEARFYFDSGYQQLSHLLRLGLMTDENPEMLRRYTFSLDVQKGPRNWLNSQDRLWMAIALNDLLKKEKPGKTDFAGRVVLKDITLMENSFSGFSENPAKTTFSLFDQIIPIANQNELSSLQFRKEGRGTLFYASTLNYALPNEVAPARDEGLSLYTPDRNSKRGSNRGRRSRTGGDIQDAGYTKYIQEQELCKSVRPGSLGSRDCRSQLLGLLQLSQQGRQSVRNLDARNRVRR